MHGNMYTHTLTQTHSTLLSGWVQAIHLTRSSSLSKISNHDWLKGPIPSKIRFCPGQQTKVQRGAPSGSGLYWNSFLYWVHLNVTLCNTPALSPVGHTDSRRWRRFCSVRQCTAGSRKSSLLAVFIVLIQSVTLEVFQPGSVPVFIYTNKVGLEWSAVRCFDLHSFLPSSVM